MSDEASAMNHQPDYQEPTPDDLRTAIDKFEDLNTAEDRYNLFFDISENLEANDQPKMGRLASYIRRFRYSTTVSSSSRFALNDSWAKSRRNCPKGTATTLPKTKLTHMAQKVFQKLDIPD